MIASLAKLGWLNAHRAKLDPAVRGVGFVEEKCADQHQQHHANRGAYHAGLAQAAVIGAHQREHTEDSENQPHCLAHEKNVRAGRIGGPR